MAEVCRGNMTCTSAAARADARASQSLLAAPRNSAGWKRLWCCCRRDACGRQPVRGAAQGAVPADGSRPTRPGASLPAREEFCNVLCCCTCINNFSFSSMTLSTCLHELSGSQRASLSVTLCPRNKRTAAPQIARGPACNEEHPCPSAGAHVREAMVYVRRGRHGLRPMHHTFLLAAQTEVWRHHVSIECIAPALVTSRQLQLQLNDSILATVQ